MSAHHILLGGAGFVGVNLAARLVKGGATVTIVDTFQMSSFAYRSYLESLPGVELMKGDARDAAAVRAALRSDTSAIFHLASVVGVQNVLRNPIEMIEVNIIGAMRIAEVCMERDLKLMFASSSEVFGRNPKVPWREDDDRVYGPPSKDRWAYATVKGLVEHLLNSFHNQRGLRSTIFRFFNVYGPFQRPYFVASAALYHFLRGERPRLDDDGMQTRCFTFIEDAADAVAKLAHAPNTDGRTYNVGSQFEHSVRDLMEIAQKVSGSTLAPEMKHSAATYGAGFDPILRRVPEVTRIKEDIGWTANTTLEDGLGRFKAWIDENPWWLETRPT